MMIGSVKLMRLPIWMGFGLLVMMLQWGLSQSLYAQAQNNIRVIVMGEDEDKNSVIRSSNIYKRVMAEIKESTFRHGFVMVDEEMLAVELGWRITERRPKTELVQAAKLANQESQANLYSRALTLFRIFASKEDLSFSTKINVRVEGEIYDLENNSFLGAFELPRISASAPADCNSLCLRERVGDKARDIAAGIGDVLGKKLAYLSPVPSVPSHSAALPSRNDPRCNSMVTSYTLEFKRFANRDISTIMNTISNSHGNIAETDRFPCYQSHDMMQGGNSTLRRYSYSTTASRAKLYDWLNLILMDLGHVPDQNVMIINNGNTIILEQIISSQNNQIDTSGSKFQ